MTIFETERMIIKTNLIISNDALIFPIENSDEIDISNLRAHVAENGGFGCYDKKDQTIKICHIGLEPKTYPLELSYGIEKDVKETYEGKKYMQEALRACLAWLFTSANVDQLYACLCPKPRTKDLHCNGFKSKNEASEHILRKFNFKFLMIVETKSEVWYTLTKRDYLELTAESDRIISYL